MLVCPQCKHGVQALSRREADGCFCDAARNCGVHHTDRGADARFAGSAI